MFRMVSAVWMDFKILFPNFPGYILNQNPWILSPSAAHEKMETLGSISRFWPRNWDALELEIH